jgi:hypothetical protein
VPLGHDDQIGFLGPGRIDNLLADISQPQASAPAQTTEEMAEKTFDVRIEPGLSRAPHPSENIFERAILGKNAGCYLASAERGDLGKRKRNNVINNQLGVMVPGESYGARKANSGVGGEVCRAQDGSDLHIGLHGSFTRSRHSVWTN